MQTGKLPFILIVVFSLMFSNAWLMAQNHVPFTATTLDSTVFNNRQGVAVRGKLLLDQNTVSFDSSEIVLSLPTKDITGVEYQGTRKDFLTLVLDSNSKFISLYPFLLSQRNDAYRQRESVLIISLGAKEAVDVSAKAARSFQSFVAAQNDAAAKALVGPVNIDASDRAAHPFLGTTIRVVVNLFDYPNTGSPTGLVRGFLTFFPDRIQFSSRDLTFVLPYNIAVQVDCAGARETFLRVGLDPRSKFNQQYEKYLAVENFHRVPAMLFTLDVNEQVGPSYKTALDFQEYMNGLFSGKSKALAGASSPADSSTAPAQISEGRELGKVEVGLLEKHFPKSAINGWKLINGIPGDLVAFDGGIGYVSKKVQPDVKPAKKQFLKDGYLKFFIPINAVLAKEDVSVIRNRGNLNDSTNSFIIQIDVARDSDFFREHNGLMAESDQDNRLFFVFKNKSAFDQFTNFFPRLSSRDKF